MAAPVVVANAGTTKRIVVGSNRGAWESFKAAIPRARGVRIYYDSTDPRRWPKTWPHTAVGAWSLLSLRPLPGPLLSGAYDTQLKALLASAPAHSELTFWHENEPGNPLGYSKAVSNPGTEVKMMEYGQKLTAGTKVRFGEIICAPANQMLNWLAPGLGWYGYDFYQTPNTSNPDGTVSDAKIRNRLSHQLAAFRAASHERFPMMEIPESNSRLDRHRRTWFTDVITWLCHHDGSRPSWVLSFWDGHQGLSGPWPPSAAVKARLRYLAWEYRS